MVLPFYKLAKLTEGLRAAAMLPDWLTAPQHTAMAGRISRFLEGFASPADVAKAPGAALPVPIPKSEFTTLRRQWLAVVLRACGTDREARRRASERVRDFFKRHFKPTP